MGYSLDLSPRSESRSSGLARTSGYIRFQLNVCSPDVESASGPSIIIVLAPRMTTRTAPRRRTAATRGKCEDSLFSSIVCLAANEKLASDRSTASLFPVPDVYSPIETFARLCAGKSEPRISFLRYKCMGTYEEWLYCAVAAWL